MAQVCIYGLKNAGIETFSPISEHYFYLQNCRKIENFYSMQARYFFSLYKHVFLQNLLHMFTVNVPWVFLAVKINSLRCNLRHTHC